MRHHVMDLVSKLTTARKSPSMMREGTGQIPHRKKNDKGFTLVELIVVIVILAILAALLVPALVGWIDKAREKSYAVEARTVYLATQTYVAENYKAGDTPISKIQSTDTDTLKYVRDLSGVNLTEITSITYDPTNNTSASATHTIIGMTVKFKPASEGSGGSEVTMQLLDGQWKKI